MNFNKIKYSLLGVAACLLLTVTSCKIEDDPNPNGASYDQFLDGASLTELRLIANGVQSVMRSDIEYYYWTVSGVGREYYDLRAVDPRFTGELLGQDGVALDNAGFLTTRVFSSRYQSVRNANLLITAVTNSDAGLSTAEMNGFMGFAKTVMAHDLLLVLNHQYQNGIRLDVEALEIEELGPFVSYAEALAGIATILDDGANLLADSGAEFAFSLTDGFAGFDTPAEMIKFNQAIAARVALYQGDKTQVLAKLGNSFMDLTGNYDNGVSLVWSESPNDRPNPLFNVYDRDYYMAALDVVASAEAGDARFDQKLDTIPGIRTVAGLDGKYQVQMYSTNADPVPIIRNEELVLIYAEAKIGSDNAAAQTVLDDIRAAAGLAPAVYATTPPTDAELVTQLIHERRYSLFGEGHRWVDMRRWGMLGDIVVDRVDDIVHEQFPRPASEGE